MLIKCPECGKEVSDKATNCIHCGYPLPPVEAPRKISIAPSPTPTKRAPVKRCRKCGAMYPAEDEGCPSCGKSGGRIMKEHHSIMPTDEKPKPIIRCPTCGSTDVERVSTLARAVDFWVWGLIGNKRNKQFECKSCRYMW